jgi:hypothetical protein
MVAVVSIPTVHLRNIGNDQSQSLRQGSPLMKMPARLDLGTPLLRHENKMRTTSQWGSCK